MHLESDVVNIYQFLKVTPEGALRQMLVGDKMSDAHFRLLMKIVRGCPEAQFVDCFQSESMPKIKLNAVEMALKENLWSVTKSKFMTLGLLCAEVSMPKAA